MQEPLAEQPSVGWKQRIRGEVGTSQPSKRFQNVAGHSTRWVRLWLTARWSDDLLMSRTAAHLAIILLVVLAIGLAAIGLALWLVAGAMILPALLLALSMAAWVGFILFQSVGRDVYLVFAVIASAIRRVLSWVVLVLMYLLFIGLFGSILRLCGMNRLERNFKSCRDKESMLVNPPATDADSLRRQS